MVHDAAPPPVVDLTALLARWGDGDSQAIERITAHVYEELRRIAHARLRMEQPGGTLETTGLVHEAWLKLIDVRRVRWNDRQHFFSMASRLMRRILVEHARRRNAYKRRSVSNVADGGEELLVAVDQADAIVELDEALRRLEAEHPRPAHVVELLYFGGLSQQQTAEVVGISQPTVARDLRFAHTWLRRELQ